jgi:hypothetical protein
MTVVTSTDLLTHARALVQAGSPTAADLSRSVSAAYYALFHCIIETARNKFVLSNRHDVQRAFTASFDHKPMRHICDQVRACADVQLRNTLTKGGLPEVWVTLFQEAPDQGGEPIRAKRLRRPDADLLTVCTAFSEAQDLRHQADYNLEWSPSHDQATSRVQATEDAIEAWNACRGSDDAEVFMLATMGCLKFR